MCNNSSFFFLEESGCFNRFGLYSNQASINLSDFNQSMYGSRY